MACTGAVSFALYDAGIGTQIIVKNMKEKKINGRALVLNKMSRTTPLRLRPRDLRSLALRLILVIATGIAIGTTISYVIFICTRQL